MCCLKLKYQYHDAAKFIQYTMHIRETMQIVLLRIFPISHKAVLTNANFVSCAKSNSLNNISFSFFIISLLHKCWEAYHEKNKI